MIFNFPLTIRSTVPSSWTQVQITQGSTTVTFTPVVEDGETVVYYGATPNGGEIMLMGGGGPGNPIPVLIAMTPASALAGSGDLTLTVYGSSFMPGVAVRWNGGNYTTSFVSSIN